MRLFSLPFRWFLLLRTAQMYTLTYHDFQTLSTVLPARLSLQQEALSFPTDTLKHLTGYLSHNKGILCYHNLVKMDYREG